MKGYASLTPSQKHSLESAGWFDVEDTGEQTDANTYFHVNIPLKLLLGLCEYYNNIVVNAKHELVLTRSNTDHNATIQSEQEDYKMTLGKVKTDTALTLTFQTWSLYEYPKLPATPKHI